MSADAVRVGEVIPLASRTREAQLRTPQGKDLSSAEPAGFADVVLPAEVADGEPLDGRGRASCAEAFATHPAGFVAAVAHAVAAKNRPSKPAQSARGLLVWMVVKDGWHIRADRIAKAAETTSTPNHCGCSHPGCRFQDVCLEESSS